ncbi:uncharacterized protein LOC133194861 [Saccostrea echinata]|uniref:uncharacterized protein LOC133194861 n=1 Tax=Saccostrea echinata TaxID=191078 RepID=UPI002A816302|nr:uncharacterized protein LOC133194861 [Saccostrea echinata]
MGNGESVAYMRPSEIRYTHDSIQANFRDGTPLESTFHQLVYKKIQVDTLPMIEVMQYNGYWFVVRGNRRLFLLKKLEEYDQVSTVQVLRKPFDPDVFERQFTTNNMGTSVKIRGGIYGTPLELRLNEIWTEYQNSESCTIS